MSLTKYFKLSHIQSSIDNFYSSFQKKAGQLFVKAVAILGFIAFAKWSLRGMRSIYLNLIAKQRNITERYGKGSFVVITGCTRGIGAAFAEYFASLGFNLVLLARNENELKRVTEELGEKFNGIIIKPITADFSKSFEKGFFEKILEQLADVDVSILVNNVASFKAAYFVDLTEKEAFDLAIVNCLPALVLTQGLLPQMNKRPQRSAVISIGSTSALHPIAGLSVLSANKRFLNSLSQGLGVEYSGIDFLAVNPANVSTEYLPGLKPSPVSITPREFVEAAVSKLGICTACFGHWKHWFAGCMFMSPMGNHIRKTIYARMREAQIE